MGQSYVMGLNSSGNSVISVEMRSAKSARCPFVRNCGKGGRGSRRRRRGRAIDTEGFDGGN